MKTIGQLIYMIKYNIEFDESATQDLLETLCDINKKFHHLINTNAQLRKDNQNLKNELDDLRTDFEEKCDEYVTLEAEYKQLIMRLHSLHDMLKDFNTDITGYFNKYLNK